MAKAFGEDEKSQIRDALMAAGRVRFAKVGVRPVRVDDLCHDVGIAKGSFYNFFASKEDLFMTIANEQDARHKREVMTVLAAAGGDAAEVIGRLFDVFMDRLETDPIFAIVRDGGELQALMRKVSPDLLQQNTDADQVFLQQVAVYLSERFPGIAATAELLEHLVTLMLTLAMQKAIVERAGHYAATVALLRELFVGRLVSGAEPVCSDPGDVFLFMAELAQGDSA